MIALDVKIGGNKKGSVKLGRFSRQLKPNLKRGVDRATLILETEIKLNLGKGGSFRKLKGEQWVRNPGPNLRIGDGTLRSSWKHTPAKQVHPPPLCDVKVAGSIYTPPTDPHTLAFRLVAISSLFPKVHIQKYRLETVFAPFPTPFGPTFFCEQV